jgi:DNA-binding NarL/FixJ family response regulator
VTEGVEVVVVEDDAMVREWVRVAFEGSEFRVAGVAASAGEALALIRRRRPRLALIDYRLPDQLGTKLVRELRRDGNSTWAVLMTANPEGGFNETAREAGAQGTVLKSGRIDEVLGTLRQVLAEGASFDGRHPKRTSGRVALSPRERQVLVLIAQGATNRDAARELGIGEQTVKTLLARAFSKLGVSRRSEAVAAAYEAGLL